MLKHPLSVAYATSTPSYMNPDVKEDKALFTN